jgi:hypothetical protein
MDRGGRPGAHSSTLVLVPVGRFRRSIFTVGALLVCALPAAAPARAAIPVAPPDGAKVDSTPTFAWGPAPDESANQIELSPVRTLAEDGSFADDPRERTVQLEDTQTSYTVPLSEQLLAGTWYWHVQTLNFDLDPCCTQWTEVRRVVVRDGPIRLSSFRVGFIRGLDQLVLRVAYTDNSLDLGARYRLLFKRRRHGRIRARVRGRLDRGNFQGGEAFDSAGRPRRLKRGRRYFVRLELRDAAGHVARSGYVRIRL